MTPTTGPPPEAPFGSASQDDRLDSWKEIAAFLRRDVRTVQRWEKQAGLPVHRHPEGRLRTAYAYRSELDAWWRAQRPVDAAGDPFAAEAGPEAPEPSALAPAAEEPAGADRSSAAGSGSASAPRRAAVGWVAALVSLAVLVGLVATALRDPLVTTGVGSSTSPDAVPLLVLPFEDEDGDRRLEGALGEAVGRALTADGRFDFLARSRVSQVLALMRRDPATRLNEALAREVALRDGRQPYIVAGRTHSLDDRYMADLHAIDPADGRIVSSLEWQAPTIAALISDAPSHVTRLSSALSDAAARRPAARPLEPVTTESLTALQLYTEAVEAGTRRQWGASESLAERALAADPDFPSALAWTGLAIRQQGRPLDEALPFLVRAASLADQVTHRESHLMLGMHHAIAGNLDAAVAELEALLRLYPGDRQGLDLLEEIYWRIGRPNKSIDLALVRAESYADDFHALVGAAQALTLGGRDPERAAGFARRAQALDTARTHPAGTAWLAGLRMFQRWLAGDRQALQDLDLLDQGLFARVGRDRDTAASLAGFAYLALGRADAAERTLRYGATPERQLNLAMLALVRDDEAAARRWLLQVQPHAALRPALFARAGLSQDAERGLASAPPSRYAEGLEAVARGLLDARKGRRERAALTLRRGADLLRWSGEPEYFFALEELARLSTASGDAERAIAYLEMAAAERAHTYGISQWTGGYWAKLGRDLAALYQAGGRDEDAARMRLTLGRVKCDGS